LLRDSNDPCGAIIDEVVERTAAGGARVTAGGSAFQLFFWNATKSRCHDGSANTCAYRALQSLRDNN